MKSFVAKLAYAAVMGGFLASGASAAQVSCGNTTLGVRLTVVDPGLVGGYCYAQNGNLKNANITALGLNLIEKDNQTDGNFGAGNLTGGVNDAKAGNWSINAALWNVWNQIYLGFHFGSGGDTTDSNPDSFIIELKRPDATGTWALTGTNAKLTGLSNMYLLSKGPCTTNCGGGGGGGGGNVPEPTSLALVGLAMLALAAVRRRKR